MKSITLCYTPFTGLGNFGGFRGNRWLKNRITIFKQFVIPSLLNQTNRDFIHWISWRPEEKRNPIVKELENYLKGIDKYKFVFTFHGLCFWDDKFSDEVARDKLLTNLHGTMGELVNIIGEMDYVLMVLVPSDDLYHKEAVEGIQRTFEEQPDLQAIGFQKGYICNYLTKEVAYYNPSTNPPFYTIKFPKEIFIDPLKHAEYTSIKKDMGKYKAGTPCPSHEYIGEALKYGVANERGFLVGCHSENISTHFNHPFKGQAVSQEVLRDFGIYDVPVLKIKTALIKRIMRRLPHKVQRKLRYWFGEKLFQKIYEFFAK